MPIKIYTSLRCPACQTVKKYLKMKGREFIELGVDYSPENGKEAHRISGVMTTPIVVIGDTVIRGCRFSEINQALSTANIPF